MKKTLTTLLAMIILGGSACGLAATASAQTPLPTETENIIPLTSPAPEATQSATVSAVLVNPEARQIIQEKKDQDVTETTGGKTDELTAHLMEHADRPLAWNNFLQYSMRQAINEGMPSNLLVLLILFPLVSSIIAFSRHVVGLRGFGIYTPAILSVALVSTGIPIGIIIFIIIVVVSVLLHRLLRRANIAHLPKTAVILWGVCLSMIVLLIASANLGIKAFLSLSIFPLLILISLSENFTSTQLLTSTKEAVRLTLETLIIAIVSALIIGNNAVQRFVIVNPELTLLATLIVDILIGRYNGLRLMELVRFQALVKKD